MTSSQISLSNGVYVHFTRQKKQGAAPPPLHRTDTHKNYHVKLQLYKGKFAKVIRLFDVTETGRVGITQSICGQRVKWGNIWLHNSTITMNYYIRCIITLCRCRYCLDEQVLSKNRTVILAQLLIQSHYPHTCTQPTCTCTCHHYESLHNDTSISPWFPLASRGERDEVKYNETHVVYTNNMSALSLHKSRVCKI